ncbi:hypothetical protein ACFVWN_28540 [Nocardiopsis flavescens]|uniref:Uncharacterized protein n=1 Tax=Nocardiopsis flavescens TaxID=758803 RepID=A0A1M6UHW8_9ACTN|nr:hypothetical protein [Nocardiopsis flavescens]SHK68812.1 hypothetical protein SAMN05421803_1286 [Nocardiopsis flavescens]
MSLVLLAIGAVPVLVAMFNKVPRYVPPRPGRVSPRGGGTATRTAPAPPGLRLASAHLTEQGRALLTTLGGSAMIIAFFLALSGY